MPPLKTLDVSVIYGVGPRQDVLPHKPVEQPRLLPYPPHPERRDGRREIQHRVEDKVWDEQLPDLARRRRSAAVDDKAGHGNRDGVNVVPDLPIDDKGDDRRRDEAGHDAAAHDKVLRIDVAYPQDDDRCECSPCQCTFVSSSVRRAYLVRRRAQTQIG